MLKKKEIRSSFVSISSNIQVNNYLMLPTGLGRLVERLMPLGVEAPGSNLGWANEFSNFGVLTSNQLICYSKK